MSENRRYPRFHSRLRCWCEGENVTFYARVGNISEGGVFLRTSTPLGRGSRARVRLELSGAAPFCAEAVVMWARQGATTDETGMGLRFDSLETSAADQLRQLLVTPMAR
ncbi:MAG: TIGR02266 family protein [Myxococcaceae bacterium]